MQRRSFLASLIGIPLAALVPFQSKPKTWDDITRSKVPQFKSSYKGTKGGVAQYELYLQYNMELLVNNPRYAGVITDIGV